METNYTIYTCIYSERVRFFVHGDKDLLEYTYIHFGKACCCYTYSLCCFLIKCNNANAPTCRCDRIYNFEEGISKQRIHGEMLSIITQKVCSSNGINRDNT